MSTREEIEALGFKVPDSIEPIVACRSWLMFSMKTLNSHCGAQWVPGEAMNASCLHYIRYSSIKKIMHVDGKFVDHESPVGNCTCGIYAAKEKDANKLVPAGEVYGEVYMWGRILEGTRGYRAEYAYPKQFFVRNNLVQKQVKQMGFGVPITVVGGRPSAGFPFPPSKKKRAKQLLYSLNGAPCLVVGAVDSVTLNLAKTGNLVLVLLMYGVGAMGVAGTLWARRILNRMKRFP